MDLVKPYESTVVGQKFTITSYVPQHTDVLRYTVRIRHWGKQVSSLTYTASLDDLLRLRDWINSALIAEHARKQRKHSE